MVLISQRTASTPNLSQASELIAQPLVAHLVEDFPHVGLRLPKPHGEQLRTLDGDEVGLALISNGFGQQCFPTAMGCFLLRDMLSWEARKTSIPGSSKESSP